MRRTALSILFGLAVAAVMIGAAVVIGWAVDVTWVAVLAVTGFAAVALDLTRRLRRTRA